MTANGTYTGTRAYDRPFVPHASSVRNRPDPGRSARNPPGQSPQYGQKQGKAERGQSRPSQRAQSQARAAKASPVREEPVMYVYDRICRKESKQRELYRAYGTAGGRRTSRGSSSVRYASPRNGGTKAARKGRYKIVIESIINLFDSIDERRNKDVEAAKRNAIMKKKLLEHRRGFFLALFMIGFFAVIALLIYNLFFGIRTIEANGTEQYTPEEIVSSSGIELGDKLYSFRASEVEGQIPFLCPYIRSVDLTRTIPDRVNLAIEADSAAYYANIYGENVVLSAGLRVLGPYDAAAGVELMEVRLPEIEYSVAGRVLGFVNSKNDRYIRSVLSIIEKSSLAGRIDMVDLTNEYDIVLHCDGIYLMKMGGEKDMESKLKMAEKAMADSAFQAGTPAEIDLSVVGEASVMYDHNLRLDSEP